jgi:hypothetical protein
MSFEFNIDAGTGHQEEPDVETPRLENGGTSTGSIIEGDVEPASENSHLPDFARQISSLIVVQLEQMDSGNLPDLQGLRKMIKQNMVAERAPGPAYVHIPDGFPDVDDEEGVVDLIFPMVVQNLNEHGIVILDKS